MPASADIGADPGVPADVAAVFASVGMTATPYRDFSSEREVHRASQREAKRRVAGVDHNVAATCMEVDGPAEAEHNPASRQESLLTSGTTSGEDWTGSEMFAERIPLKRRAQGWSVLQDRPKAQRMEPSDGAASCDRVVPFAMETAQIVEQYARGLAGTAETLLSAKAERVERPKPRAQWLGSARESLRANGAATCKTGGNGSEPAPEWLRSSTFTDSVSFTRPAAHEALQSSREKMTTRWYALRGLLHPASPALANNKIDMPEKDTPILAFYSVAGGVGKTSLAASLTRALAAQGERVLLVDTTQRQVLPFYLGARDLRPETVRTFTPPSGGTDQPIQLISYGIGEVDTHAATAEGLGDWIRRNGKGFSRVVVDVASGVESTFAVLTALGASVLVPLLPDMNSLMTLPSIQRSLPAAQVQGHGGTAFLLTHFEASQPLQIDIREALQKQLGDALLPFVIRRSPAIAEALAEGMTVLDYAPGEGVAKDFLELAAWVRDTAEPVRTGLAQARWNER